jgi:hypothetical protein
MGAFDRLFAIIANEPDLLWLTRLRDVANEMDAEDGLIWVSGVGQDGIIAFTDFRIEPLIEFIRIHKENPKLLRP